MSGNDQGGGSSSSDTDNDDKEALPDSIDSVWDHPRIEKITVDVPTPNGRTKQKVTWTCHMCNTTWSGNNPTKALAHGTRDMGYCLFQHVVPCAGNATKAEIKLFTDLYKRGGRGGSPRSAW